MHKIGTVYRPLIIYSPEIHYNGNDRDVYLVLAWSGVHIAPSDQGNDSDVYLVIAWSRVHMAASYHGNDRVVSTGSFSLVKRPYCSM